LLGARPAGAKETTMRRPVPLYPCKGRQKRPRPCAASAAVLLPCAGGKGRAAACAETAPCSHSPRPCATQTWRPLQLPWLRQQAFWGRMDRAAQTLAGAAPRTLRCGLCAVDSAPWTRGSYGGLALPLPPSALVVSMCAAFKDRRNVGQGLGAAEPLCKGPMGCSGVQPDHAARWARRTLTPHPTHCAKTRPRRMPLCVGCVHSAALGVP
jgi:hypothetical protein